MPTDLPKTRHEPDSGILTVAIGEGAASAPGGLPTAESYDLVGEIGRGGMGTVYRARDPVLGREVAVKVLSDRYPVGSSAARRFLDEARITAQLQHPGIPPVFEVGELPDGRPYLAMRLIEGRTLDDLLETRADPAADRGRFVAIFEQVCQAVAYAHSRGVIHRDLKPANVMVGSFGEVQVMDWGLAKVLGAADPEERADPPQPPPGRAVPYSDSLTEAGTILGTPAYMPPEQATGDVGLVDTRSDVFGLGAILCAVLTGQAPYTGDVDTVRLAATQGRLADALRRLADCGAEPDLVALARGCLAPDPGARPMDAGAVAVAVAGLRAGAEARARRAELDRARAEVAAVAERRRRRAHVALAAVALALVGLAGGVGWWYQSARAAAAAEQAVRRAATESTVAAALDEASVRTAEAWDLTDRPDRMRVAADLALAAVGRAEGAVATGDPSAESRARMAAARAAADDLNRHARLLEAGEHALQEFAVLTDGHWDRPRLLGRLREAFRAFGWDVGGEPADRLADRVATSRVRDKVLGLLCDWSFQAGVAGGGYQAERDQTAAVVRLVRLRAGGLLARWQSASDSADRQALVRLAADPDVTGLGPELFLELGRNLGDAGAVEARVVLLRRAADRYPTHVWVRENLAEACEAHSPPLAAEALWHASAAAALRPESATCQYHVGKALRLAGEYARAAEVLRRAAAQFPREPEVQYELGTCLLGAGDAAGAVAALRQAVAGNPRNAALRMRLADALAADGQRDLAVAAYREAAAIAPQSPAIQANLADVLLLQGNVNGAAAACDRAARLGADSVSFAAVLARLAVELVSHGRGAEAEPHLRRALAIREGAVPDDWTTANTRSLLGEALVGQGKYQEAEPLLRRGYTGLREREVSIPAAVRGLRLREAAGRLERWADATGDRAESARWRAAAASPEAGPPPRRID
jgi:serine/threonine-protein kinase